jgi:translation initiation factor IF-3
MDLVEIAANTTPPIERIADCKKFLEDQKKRTEHPDYSGN